MYFLKFDIDPDRVVLDDAILFRPKRIASTQWMEFWEDVRDLAEYGASKTDELLSDIAISRGKVAALEYDVEERDREIEKLEVEVRELSARIQELEGMLDKC